MHASERLTSEYKTLSSQGVWCARLRAFMHQDTRWELEFNWASHVSRAEAKELMIAFLQSQYQAFDLSFYIKTGETRKAHVKFSSWCL